MLLSRKGNVFLKTALVTAAITGCRRRGGTHPAEKYRRLRARAPPGYFHDRASPFAGGPGGKATWRVQGGARSFPGSSNRPGVAASYARGQKQPR
jgi:hypothetical protein